MEYLAHYDREKDEKHLLNEHVGAVALLSKKRIPDPVNFEDIDNSIIKELSYYLGLFHDLGKYTDYFQRYMKEGKESSLKNHAHISACFVYLYLSAKLNLGQEEKTVLVFLAYLCVRRHHSSLSLRGLFPVSYDIWPNLKLQGTHLKAKADEILNDLKMKDDLDPKEFCKYLRTGNLEKDKLNFLYVPNCFASGRIKHHKWFFILVYLFSVLIDNDKLDAAHIDLKQVKTVPPDNVIKYLEHRKSNAGPGAENLGMNTRREKARKTMLKVVDDLTDEEVKSTRLFTLTAPTGIGKTLSSLQCALRLQERIFQVENYTPRIITAIPFVNIIEQNRKVYEDVFGEQVKMIVHHRLSDFFGKADEGRDTTPVDKVLMETESWEGDVILTTFVQLFQSIFTGKNKPLKKYNKLAGSIIILDEAQALPEDYMPIIGAMLQMFSRYYGTRFILMTATQPKLLEFGDKLLAWGKVKNDNCRAKSLLPDYPRYFENLNRTKFIPMLEDKMDEDKFIGLFFEKWNPKKSVLVVVNTIKRSIDLYKRINKEIVKRGHQIPVYYLSTNLVPLDRRKIIRKVKKVLCSGKKVILVSTQTIEAGVDLDFDMAFRDFAPLDSLIQTAGRVNRSGGKTVYSPIYIVRLENDNHYIYNLTHRKTTQNFLARKDEILEHEYGQLADDYYDLALKRGISDKSKDLWKEGIVKLDFEFLQKFELIEKSLEVRDVFVEKDSYATKLADTYEELLKYGKGSKLNLRSVFPPNVVKQFAKELNVHQRKILLKAVLAKMNDYIIQIRWNKLKRNLPVNFSARGGTMSDLLWVPPGELSRYYDDGVTGFIDELGEALMY